MGYVDPNAIDNYYLLYKHDGGIWPMKTKQIDETHVEIADLPNVRLFFSQSPSPGLEAAVLGM